MKKETFKLSELGININEAHLGPWVPVSQVETPTEPLHGSLKPHVVDGKIPVRLVKRVKTLVADVKPAENL